MDRLSVERWCAEHFAGHPGNVVSAEMASDHPQVTGLVMYDAPILGVADAADPLFERYKSWDVIAPFHMTPDEWLPGAKSVISLFFPLSERVRASNRGAPAETSYEWLYARIEGQAFIAGGVAALTGSAGVRSGVRSAFRCGARRRRSVGKLAGRDERRVRQQLVGASCGVCRRSGHVQPDARTDHPSGHGGPLRQRDRRYAAGGHAAAVQRSV